MDEQIIYGRNAVTEALLSGKTIDTVYIQKNAKGLGKIVSLAKDAGAVVKDANDDKLSQLSEGGKHGGVAAVLAAAEYATVDDLLKVAEEKGEPPFLIIAPRGAPIKKNIKHANDNVNFLCHSNECFVKYQSESAITVLLYCTSFATVFIRETALLIILLA